MDNTMTYNPGRGTNLADMQRTVGNSPMGLQVTKLSEIADRLQMLLNRSSAHEQRLSDVIERANGGVNEATSEDPGKKPYVPDGIVARAFNLLQLIDDVTLKTERHIEGIEKLV